MVVIFQNAMVSQFCVRPTSKRWVLKTVQVRIHHDPFDIVDFTSILHSLTPVVPQP